MRTSSARGTMGDAHKWSTRDRVGWRLSNCVDRARVVSVAGARQTVKDLRGRSGGMRRCAGGCASRVRLPVTT